MSQKGYCTLERRGAVFICTGCKKKLPGTIPLPIWRMCDVNPPGNLLPSVPQHRERTTEEYAIVTGICYACDHYQPAPGICGLKAKSGCGACRGGAAFTRFKKSGLPCPDGRFEGTELVEPAPPGQ